MKQIYQIAAAACLTLTGALGVSAATYSPAPEGTRAPLRFSHRRPAANGLYTVAERKPCRVPMRASSEGRPELIANCTTSKVGFGMYSFFAEPDLTLQKAADTPAFFGGAVYVNGKYYACDYDYDNEYNLTYVRWYVYDALTWRCEKMVDNPLDFSYIATDRTYDSTTGTVYSITYDKSGGAIWLSTTSLSDGASTMIAPLEKDVITIAADADGQLFGIDTAANLYRINKTTAALTLVGNTKIYDEYQSDYTQSITIDQTTGKLYWAEFHSLGIFTSESALYEVDTTDASTVKIADFPGAPEFIGLYVADYMAAGVPAAVSGLQAVPASEGSLSYTFSFTAPTVSVDGQSLGSEQLAIEVTVDGDLVDIREAAPGSKVTCGPIDLPRGLRTLKVTAENSKGVGATAAEMFFAGYDVPAAPRGVTLTAEGSKATVSWEEVVFGAEGGAVRGPVTYNVVRMPGNVAVATATQQTTCTDNVASPGLYTYRVTAVSPDGEGPAGESNGVVMGSFPVPYSCGFDTQEEFDLFTIVDITSNGRVWNYDVENRRLRHPWSMYDEIDDYIVSPGIELNSSNSYTVSFDANQMVASYNEHIMLYFGDNPDPTTMKLVLDTGKLPEAPTAYSGTVAPAHDGPHYFALRSKTGKNGFMSYADNFKVVVKGQSNVPAAVADLAATPAPAGETAVTISLTAPSTTLQGSPLAEISRIDIIRGFGDEPIKTFTAPAPGEKLSWTDTSVATGSYTYRAIVYSPQGQSEPATVSAFAGIDEPGAPTDVDATGPDGNRKLSWIAPKAGVNGGNLEGLLTYRIVRMVNDEEQLIDDAYTGTEFTDTWMPDRQAFVYYTVSARTSAGESAAVASRTFAVGHPYELPYEESFADGKSQTAPWSVESVVGFSGSWDILPTGENPYTKPQDADGGLATFDGYHATTNGSELRLVSPNINISNFEDPELTFYIYHFDGLAGWWQEDPDPVGESMQVEISVAGAPFEVIPGTDINLYSSKSGWKQYKVSLAQYRRSPGVRIAFRGKSAGNFNIHIDNIAIKGTKGVEGVSDAYTPASRIAGGVGFVSYAGIQGGVKVYDTAGRIVAASAEAEGRILLPAGIYIVAGSGDVAKVAVR